MTFYGSLWVLIIVLHSVVLYYYYELPLSTSIVDSLVFNILVSGFCLGYWYVVKYVSPTAQGMGTTVVTHLLGVSLAVLLVSFITQMLLGAMIKPEAYQDFLSHTFLLRIFVGLLYFTIMIMLYYLLTYIRDLKEKDKREAQLHQMLKQSELDMLKFQINPHFLFNSLNSISALTLTAPDMAREMVLKLADFFRSSLGKDNLEVHTLKEEINQMNLYLDIEKVRFGDRLAVKEEIDKACYDLVLPKMILQPLYENAIKFGMYDQLAPLLITIICQCAAKDLSISITNNTEMAMSNLTSRKGNGIGLSNVVNRLELIYGLPNLVSIDQKKDSFTVNLSIPQLP